MLRREAKSRKRQDPVYDLEEYDGPTWVDPPVPRKKKKGLGPKEIVYICLLCFMISSWFWFLLRRTVLKPWIVLGCQSKETYELWQVSVKQRFPMLCPACNFEKLDACIVVECAECGKLRFILNYHDVELCPECGQTRLFEDIIKRCPACRGRYVERDGHDCPARKR